MADDIMTPPAIDNSGADAGLQGSPAPTSVSSGVTGVNPPPTRKVFPSDDPGEIDQTKLDGDDVELSLDDTPEQLEDKLLAKTNKQDAKTSTKQSKQSKQPVAAQAKEDKASKEQTTKDSDKQVDEGFDLGIETEEDKGKQESGKKARDYSDVADEQKEILKHVPNYLFDKAKEYIKQAAKVKSDYEALKIDYEKVKSGKLPDTYFEHEKAYLLSPDYQKAVELSQTIDFEENHYVQQLENIESGLEWQELKGYDKTGNPVFVTHPALEGNKVNVKAKIFAQRNLNLYAAKRNEVEQQLSGITNTFKQQHETTKSSFKAIEDKFFGKLKDMSKLPKEAQDYYGDIKTKLNEALPSYKDHPFIEFLSKSALSNIYKTQELAKRDAKIKQLEEKLSDTLGAGPTSKVLNGSAKVDTDVVYDMNNLDKDF